jgi:hypothetical protein
MSTKMRGWVREFTQRRRRAVAIRFARSLVLLGLMSCRDHSGIGIPEGSTYTPSDWVVAWLAGPSRIVLVHEHAWVKNDLSVADCERSGTYILTGDSLHTLHKSWSPNVCKLEVYLGNSRGKRDGTAVILVSDHRLVQWDVATDSLSVVQLDKALSPRYPSWSPDAVRIAFFGVDTFSSGTSKGTICLYLVNGDGGGLRQVANLGRISPRGAASWAPDGRKLAFSFERDSMGVPDHSFALFTVDTASGSVAEIGAGLYPSWSPSGKWIAFLAPLDDSVAGAEGRSLYISHPDGSNSHLVVANYLDGSSGSSLLGVAPGPVVWSAGSDSLAFTGLSPDGAAIWTVSVTGTGLRKRTSIPAK